MRYVEFMKRVVPMHDDLFDFFYEALPGYEEVGRRRVLLGCWGAFQDPDVCNFDYKDMTRLGPRHGRHPGRRRRRQARHQRPRRHQPRHPHPARLARSTTDWEGQEMFVTQDPLGNPVDRRHPWNQHTIPQPQKRDFDDKYSWVMSPRWFDGTDHLALDTGGGPIARLWSTALSGLVEHRLRQGHRHSVRDQPAPDGAQARGHASSGRSRSGRNAIERNRARTYFQAYAAAAALHFIEKALAEVRAGRTKTWEPFEVPDEGIGCGFTEAVRGVLCHHMVIKGGKIANYHPYPPTPWNANPRDSYGTPGPYEDAVQNTPIFEENPPDNFKGIDIMRAVRSFDPCLPCGVHMYLGKGKVLRRMHSPAGHAQPGAGQLSAAKDLRVVGERIEAQLERMRASPDPKAHERAEMTTWSRGPKPSSSTRSWLSVWSCSRLKELPLRVSPTASSSSMKMIDGELSRASSKSLRILAAPSPANISTNAEALWA